LYLDILAMSFPATGLETTYRNNLRDVAKMLQSKHQDKYMVSELNILFYWIYSVCTRMNYCVFNCCFIFTLSSDMEEWS